MYDFIDKAWEIIEKFIDIMGIPGDKDKLIDDAISTANIETMVMAFKKLPADAQIKLKDKLQNKQLSQELMNNFRKKFTDTDISIWYADSIKKILSSVLDKYKEKAELAPDKEKELREFIEKIEFI